MSDRGRGGADRDLTVLFVDDYPEYVEAGEEYLETVDEAITVVPETSAATALDRLSRERVDCVVCDYEMPGMSGLELLEFAREERPQLPFILLTGHETDRVAASTETEATEVLQKGGGTHTFEELRSRIRELTPTEPEFYFDNVTG